MVQEFISLFFPRTCINCDTSLTTEEAFLCLPCVDLLPLTEDFSNDTNDLHKKFAFSPKIVDASAYLYFEKFGITQKVLHSLKYKGRKEIGTYFGSKMGEIFPKKDIDIVVPVPIHKAKIRKRGFNQSEYIAKGFCAVTGFPLESNLIFRKVNTSSQTKKRKTERWKNQENIYSDVDTSLQGQRILIVDDMITTGATAGMLAERLLEKDAEEIYILSLARGR